MISLGISVALIAVVIWFLYNYHNNFGYSTNRWIMPHHMMRGGGMGMVMILFWVVVLGAVALLISGLVSGCRSSGGTGGSPLPDALQILKQRYANGEIDSAQFNVMRQDLQ